MIMDYETAVDDILETKLKPLVKPIDREAYYPREVIGELAEAGAFIQGTNRLHEQITREIRLVEQVSAYCMTTGFNLWCHLAALTYVRHTRNRRLKERFLPLLESGAVIGGTGLSNPMKYYAGLESLHLKAEEQPGGYVIHGVLPSVSNLGDGHRFGVIAETFDNRRIMAFVSCDHPNLHMQEKADYLGLNGSATYACRFEGVVISDEEVLSDDADLFIKDIRPSFVAYQVPIGLGVAAASVRGMEKHVNRQSGCNAYLPVQPADIKERAAAMSDSLARLSKDGRVLSAWEELLEIRRATAELVLDAVQAGMLHAGGSGYKQTSHEARRLREAYFFVNLTPTVKQLGKMLDSNGA
ncbi:acyl-CoA dehydrogenase family protein [Salisediminibacterium selenitireducens]|uniref:Acyl-CoA dehydrogenase n=1 Tax=Bacillus selenitireducens (strain ATCC 700615 / DSM 15326 / MLS10) TaxID=439292 RepID=D6XYC5_BACIE|nr:acyl-CoA dehydrogenase family protein [Salisediminibacterium selenitireducens]ADI00194.1 putative acyl-CoA dehydrogenase [[Bacillus] selenitireducens MLS10]